ncbi:MAG: hypothetical protein QF464_13160 [Myxococcota bacterium]|jgi:hypothetical protein|nr:hypothetical protein [Myxococcota bacterium]
MERLNWATLPSRLIEPVIAATPELAATGDGWQYAAWIALDLRLLLFLMFISLLASFGVCLIMTTRRDWLRLAAMFLVSYVAILSLLITIFNVVAHYPVFKVESFFPFP